MKPLCLPLLAALLLLLGCREEPTSRALEAPQPGPPPAALDQAPASLGSQPKVASTWSPARQAAWDELLKEARLQLAIPDGFHLEAGDDNIALPFEARLVSDDGRLEVRLSVRPLAELQLHFDDPHSAAPEPNHVFAMMFRAVVEELSPTGIGLESELGPEGLEPYGASWGALVALDLRPEVAPGYKEGMLLALHLEDASDAYALFLPRDLKADADLIRDAIHCLRYIREEPASKAPSDSTR